ncbi:MAG: GtrA family protein [Clostridia bacterium]|nr:GtrA family protein [Clostridia bacterium]
MSKRKTAKEMLWYLFFSALTTLVSWVTYTACMVLFQNAMHTETAVLIANGISWAVAVAFSFTVNKCLVFRSCERSAKAVLRELGVFVSTRIATGLFEIVFVPLIVWLGWDVPLFGIDGLLSKCLVTPIVILLNYLCGKFLVFGTKRQKEKAT